MAKTLSRWIKTFSECEIPVLHKSKHKLLQAQKNEEDITVTVLTEIARSDPGFSITLLRHACRSGKREITTLSHAISLIGIPFVIKLLNEATVLEDVFDEETRVRVLNVYAHQFQIAFMAKQWSILRKESEKNEIFTAGLNRGFVRFILYFINPDLAHQLDQNYLTPDDSHKNTEKELLGYTVDELAQTISNNWHLPELIRENYSGKHHNPKITGIRLAAELLRKIYSHHSIQYPEEIIKRVADYIRIPVDLTPGKINGILIKSVRKSHEQNLPHQSLTKMIMSYPSSIIKEPEIEEEQEIVRSTIFSDCINFLRIESADKSTRELIETTITGLKDGLGFSRVIFMPFKSNEKILNVALRKIDQGLPDPKKLVISIELNKLFAQLLKKEQTLCITPKNQHKYTEMLPNALRPMKSSASIIVNSFYINNKVTGCFFVDHGQTDKQLTKNELKSFKIICKELKTAIESNLVKNKSVKKVA
jgi:HD-like signal output (HDOD) protein